MLWFPPGHPRRRIFRLFLSFFSFVLQRWDEMMMKMILLLLMMNVIWLHTSSGSSIYLPAFFNFWTTWLYTSGSSEKASTSSCFNIGKIYTNQKRSYPHHCFCQMLSCRERKRTEQGKWMEFKGRMSNQIHHFSYFCTCSRVHNLFEWVGRSKGTGLILPGKHKRDQKKQREKKGRTELCKCPV